MILIKNGRVIDPASGLDELRDVLIGDDGRIAAIEACGEIEHKYSVENAEVIDATGNVVAPGFVDVHVHFRDPGLTYKEDIESGAKAAARRGYVDDIIEPDATRKRVIAAFDMLATKSEDRPYKKHIAF